MKRKDSALNKCCKKCGKEYNPKSIKRQYGEFSSVYFGGFCSARCYTLNYNNDLLTKLKAE